MTKIAVAGLGYVGLSNAVLLAQSNDVRALDVDAGRVASVNAGKLGNVNQLSTLIEENPEVFARIVKVWSGAGSNAADSGEATQDAQAKKAA